MNAVNDLHTQISHQKLHYVYYVTYDELRQNNIVETEKESFGLANAAIKDQQQQSADIYEVREKSLMGNPQIGTTTSTSIAKTIKRQGAEKAAPLSGSTTIKLEGATGTNTSKNLGTAVTFLANPQEGQNSTKTDLIDQLQDFTDNFSKKIDSTKV